MKAKLYRRDFSATGNPIAAAASEDKKQTKKKRKGLEEGEEGAKQEGIAEGGVSERVEARSVRKNLAHGARKGCEGRKLLEWRKR